MFATARWPTSVKADPLRARQDSNLRPSAPEADADRADPAVRTRANGGRVPFVSGTEVPCYKAVVPLLPRPGLLSMETYVRNSSI